MRTTIDCCRGCTPETGRSADPNCHGTCEKYITQMAEYREFKEARLADLHDEASQYKAKRRAKAVGEMNRGRLSGNRRKR